MGFALAPYVLAGHSQVPPPGLQTDSSAPTRTRAEVYLPGAGRKGLAPTDATVVGPEHIMVAVHRHAEAVPPVAGTFTGPESLSRTLIVDVQITQRSQA
jgi:transglutaminase-like putative cysteine protease